VGESELGKLLLSGEAVAGEAPAILSGKRQVSRRMILEINPEEDDQQEGMIGGLRSDEVVD
jgi:hypothetical protein